MTERRRRRPGLDERFSLHPPEGEDVLRKPLDDEDDQNTEDDDS